ncbi:MAG: secretin N-terminal domain-containing protein [Limisphaerales bacterium]
MKPPRNLNAKVGLMAVLLGLGLGARLLFWDSATPLMAQNAPEKLEKRDQTQIPTVAPGAANTNTPAPAAKPESPNRPPVSPVLSQSQPGQALEQGAQTTNQGLQSTSEPEKLSPSDEIQLSFQAANIDLVVQWLAKATGKSVVKHPKVQCQVTIVSSKKLVLRDAITLVYRALALEGFSTIESSKSILIVPEGQEPKTSPEMMDVSGAQLPEGRQRLVQVFHLKQVSPGELKEKVRGVLSEKATIEADDHGNKLIVTDYTDNLRLLGKLIQELDVASSSDTVIEIYNLKHSDADEMANLLGLVLNTSAAPPGMGMPGQPMPGMPMPGQPMPGMPMPGQPMPGRPGQPAMGGAGQGSAQQVRLWPDKTANRLIVAAPKSKLPEVQRLLNLLDTEKPAAVGVRVIALKNVSAEDLAKEIGPIYQKMSGKSLKDIIEVTADSRSNSLIVLSSEPNFNAIEKLVSALDTEEAQEKVMQAFALKNADAEDVAKQLQQLSQDQDNSSRYPFYIFSSSGSSGNKKKMSVVADRRRNTVIIQAPPGAMEGVAKLIKILDEPVTDNSLAPKIIQLKYVNAADLEDVLNELFLKKQQQRSYYFYDESPPETADRDVGRLYGKVRITSEPYSNSIILASNSPENLAAVETVIRKLDVPSEAGETTIEVSLKFAKASTVANNINILFAKGGAPALRPVAQPGQPNSNPSQPQNQAPTSSSQNNFNLEQETKEEGYYPWLGGQPDATRASDGRTLTRPVSDLVGRVRAVADDRSNALLISANVHFFPQVLKLIKELDAATDQVLIEARIVEVSTAYLDQLGVPRSPRAATFTGNDLDNSAIVSAGGQFTKGFGGTTANVPFNANTTSGAGGNSVAAIITSLRSGVVNNSINMDFLVQFLRENTHATVLAEPQVNIRDNETGRLFVGQEVPVPDNNQVSQLGGQNTTFRYKEVGVVLEVTPHINTAGDVELKIHAESSSIVPGQIILGGAVIDSRAFKTDLTAKNGQTLVLGGIIQKQVSNIVRKTPILGDIPGLGWAFKKRDKSIQDVELMVFLRPRVIRSPEDAKTLLDEIDQKTPKMKQWQNDNQPDLEKQPPPNKPGH